ncbi:hypothetical protein [Amycolatopsis thailandensis]|uniref:hypothetical protein n=1 Tax=Amycolatopsis thailandensis TaxID=589330 RepID=UPI0036265BC9
MSASQLERWRAAGLLPRRPRQGRGRGGGSATTCDPGEVEIAAALARHSRQGRDLRLVTIDWFAEAGQAGVFGPPVPEPPDQAVRDAMAWAIERSESERLLRMARQASTEDDLDVYYRRADGLLHSDETVGIQWTPGVVRRALLDGEDLPDAPANKYGDLRASLLHLTAAIGIGVDEVGTDLIAEAIASLMEEINIPADALEDITEALRDPQRSQHVREALAYAKSKDPLDAVRKADGQQLRHARKVAYGLAGCGGLYLFHGLLMPDSAGQAALRSQIDGLGLGRYLMHMASKMNSQVNSTSGIASCIAGCLDDWNSNIYDLLFAKLKNGPSLIPGGDTKESGEKFFNAWLDTMNQIAWTASGAQEVGRQ